MTEEAQPQAEEKRARQPKKVKCEVLRGIGVDDGRGGSEMVFPNKLSFDEEMENAKRKKQGKDLIKPEPMIVELEKDVAKKLQEAGAVRVAL